MIRREFLKSFGFIPYVFLMANGCSSVRINSNNIEITPLSKSVSDWRILLSRAQFHILFEEGTEPPNSSPLNQEIRKGMYICAACYLPLFNSRTKYDSGTGWPSFYRHLRGSIQTKPDYKLAYRRTEYHCMRCGGHQGHVFNDGPRPTGLRYCNNGLALKFISDDQVLPQLRT